eukprot:3870553-Pleurochrysis_carterae.AAC.1
MHSYAPAHPLICRTKTYYAELYVNRASIRTAILCTRSIHLPRRGNSRTACWVSPRQHPPPKWPPTCPLLQLCQRSESSQTASHDYCPFALQVFEIESTTLRPSLLIVC